MADLCARCNHPIIEACRGQGYIRTDENTVRPCNFMLAKQLRAHMGEEIARSSYVKSPLFQNTPEGRIDRTSENLVLQGSWPEVLPHLKWVLAQKGVLFTFRTVTDTRIKSVFCGDEQYRARPLSAREDTKTFNSLQDLMGEDVDLAIVKLGYLGYKNKAAAGALMEALLIRDEAKKATWLVQDTRPGYEWNHSRSLELEDYVGTRFSAFNIPSSGLVIQERGHGISSDDMDNLLEAEAKPKPQIRVLPAPKEEERFPDREERFVERVSVEEDMGGFLDGASKKKWGGSKKKGSGW